MGENGRHLNNKKYIKNVYTLPRSFVSVLFLLPQASLSLLRCWLNGSLFLFLTSDLWLLSQRPDFDPMKCNQRRTSETDEVNWHTNFLLPGIPSGLLRVLCYRFGRNRMLLFKMPSGQAVLGWPSHMVQI